MVERQPPSPLSSRQKLCPVDRLSGHGSRYLFFRLLLPKWLSGQIRFPFFFWFPEPLSACSTLMLADETCLSRRLHLQRSLHLEIHTYCGRRRPCFFYVRLMGGRGGAQADLLGPWVQGATRCKAKSAVQGRVQDESLLNKVLLWTLGYQTDFGALPVTACHLFCLRRP